MDNKIAAALKKAGQLIRSGDNKQAQRLLVAVLKESPRLEQAWYMLSFVVEEDRIEFVLNKVLEINPENENAKNRLEKWAAQKAEQEELIQAAAAEEIVIEQDPGIEPISEPEAEPDSEVFGNDEVEAEPEELSVSERLDSYGVEPEMDEITRQREEIQAIAPENFMDGEEFSERKGRSRIWLVLLLVIISGTFAGLFFFTDIFRTPEAVVASAPTATATEFVPTATRTMAPPTATLMPTNTETPRPTFTPTVVPSATSVVFLEPDQDVLDILIELDDQVLGMRDFQRPIEIEQYVLSPYQALSFFSSSFMDAETRDRLDSTQAILAALNVIRPDYDLEKSYFNRLGLLNSAYSQSDQEAAVFGMQLSVEQRFSYIYSYVKAQLTEQVTATTGIVPGECDWMDQQCQALTALVWGDAFFTSEVWAQTNLSDEDRAAVSRIDRREAILLDLNTPNFILADHQFAFEKGRFFASDLYNLVLWWTELDAAYQNLPYTTEQLMHINKFISEEEAVSILDPDLTEVLDFEWQELFNGSLGEWYTYLVLRHSYGLNYELADAELDDLFLGAAEGWGGDQVQVYQNPAGRNVITAHWSFDSLIDAEEFLDAITLYQNTRFSDGPPQLDNFGGLCGASDIYISCVFADEQDVLWVYAPGEELLMNVMELFQRFE